MDPVEAAIPVGILDRMSPKSKDKSGANVRGSIGASELERLRKEGFCTVDVNAEGAKLYVFGGLRSTKPLDLDDL